MPLNMIFQSKMWPHSKLVMTSQATSSWHQFVTVCIPHSELWGHCPIENNRGRIGGRWWAAVVLRGALPAAHRGGAGEMSALSLSRPTEDCAPLISYGSTVAPEEVPTINLPWWFYRGVLVGISGSGPPPLYAHYNLLLPTVPTIFLRRAP